MRLLDPTLPRGRLLRLLIPSAALFATQQPQSVQAAVKISNGVEEIRKAASLIPGYGPPDIAYPAAFRGRWQVQSRVVSVTTPLGEESAPADELKAMRLIMATEQPLTFETRFLDTENAGGIAIANERSDAVALSAKTYTGTVIADRGWNAERQAAAQPGAASLVDYTARWDAPYPHSFATLSRRAGLTLSRLTCSYRPLLRLLSPTLHGQMGSRQPERPHDDIKGLGDGVQGNEALI